MLLALMIVLGGFGLRMWMLDSESLWHDEGWSIRAIEGPFTTPDDNTPVLYYLTGHLLWRMGTGDSALAYRLTSVLLGTLTVAVALWITRRWAGWYVGLTAGLLVAMNPLLWEYAQEVRAYVAVPLIALVLLYGAGRVIIYGRGQTIPVRVWIIVFMAELIAIYTHNLGVPLVIWLNVALGLAWIYRRDVRHMLTWAGVQIALIIAYIPWLTTQSPSGTPLNSPPEPGLSLIRDIWISYFLPVLPQVQDAVANPSTMLTLILLFGAICGGMVLLSMGMMLFRQTDRLSSQQDATSTHMGWVFYLLLTHAILVPALSIALTLAANIDFHPRYVIAGVPATLILLAISTGIITARWQIVQMITLGGVIVVSGIISVMSLHDVTTTRTYQHDDFATLADYYAMLDDDSVIIIPFNDEPTLQYVFADDITAPMVNIPLYSSETIALNTLTNFEGRAIEFLTWFQLPADQRGMYPCLLGAMATDISAPFTVYGLSTQRYQLPDVLQEFEPLTIESPFQQASLLEAGYIAGENAVCVRTRWTTTQPFDENLQVALSLLNPFGAPLTRADAEIARDDNVGTSRWDNGDIGEVYHLLTLPAGLPDGNFDLLMNVYTRSNPSGLDILDISGNPAGKDYRLESALILDGVATNFEQTALIYPDIADGLTIQTGMPLELTLQINADSMPTATVSLAGEDWIVTESFDLNTGDQLAWVQLIVPAGNAGDARLTINDDLLATVMVIDPPRTFEPAPMPISLDVPFGDIARLAGADVPDTLVTDTPIEITLLWEALTTTPETSYTVFVQVLAADGRVLAQSDSMPVNGTRPTIGWLEGEYIVDTHTLNWNITDYTGEATVIAGLYDAANGFLRLSTREGATFATVNEQTRIE